MGRCCRASPNNTQQVGAAARSFPRRRHHYHRRSNSFRAVAIRTCSFRDFIPARGLAFVWIWPSLVFRFTGVCSSLTEMHVAELEEGIDSTFRCRCSRFLLVACRFGRRHGHSVSTNQHACLKSPRTPSDRLIIRPTSHQLTRFCPLKVATSTLATRSGIYSGVFEKLA